LHNAGLSNPFVAAYMPVMSVTSIYLCCSHGLSTPTYTSTLHTCCCLFSDCYSIPHGSVVLWKVNILRVCCQIWSTSPISERCYSVDTNTV